MINQRMNLRSSTTVGLIAILGCFLLPGLVLAQEGARGLSLTVAPESLTLQVGESAVLTGKVVDAAGHEREDARVIFFSRDRAALGVDRSTGEVTAFLWGTFTLTAIATTPDGDRLNQDISVTVPAPPLSSIEFLEPVEHAYQGTRLPLPLRIVDERGGVRDDIEVAFSSSDAGVATVDAYGFVHLHQTGQVTITARAEDVEEGITFTVEPNPIDQVELTATREEARTGDVIAFHAIARDGTGQMIVDAPLYYAVQVDLKDELGPAVHGSASGQIGQDGRFVAEAPGVYTVVATSGNRAASRKIRITPRDVQRGVEVVGQQSVDVYTSDLWVWEGIDGRDYAVTGTWSANGEAYFWDVTDPSKPTMIDTLTVDARTVNDVKVNERGDLCVLTREGASNRRNGLVIVDCSNPYDVRILSEFDENLTGGVHNVYMYEDLIFALSAGQRYDIIDIENPEYPHRVGSFELDVPGHAIHDVWVEDGIAYSSNWSNGVWMVDVGNGIEGGSPSNPVVIGHYAYPSGWNHAAFPYRNQETGKFYIIAGDEHFVEPNRTPVGWIHFIDFTDPENPQEVARYEVPEAGTHNVWVEDDKLYVAYYQGGVRVVDISGDLMGDLYRQGREIGQYRTEAADGFLPNKARAWGTMPHKGNIFISDKHSGLWIVKLKGDPAREAEPAS